MLETGMRFGPFFVNLCDWGGFGEGARRSAASLHGKNPGICEPLMPRGGAERMTPHIGGQRGVCAESKALLKPPTGREGEGNKKAITRHFADLHAPVAFLHRQK